MMIDGIPNRPLYFYQRTLLVKPPLKTLQVPGPPPLRLRRRFLRRHGGGGGGVTGRAAGALRDHRRFGLHGGRSDGGFRVVTLW